MACEIQRVRASLFQILSGPFDAFLYSMGSILSLLPFSTAHLLSLIHTHMYI